MVLRGDEITPIIRVSQRSCQTNDVPPKAPGRIVGLSDKWPTSDKWTVRHISDKGVIRPTGASRTSTQGSLNGVSGARPDCS